MRIAVLGAGMVGRAIALDLAKNFSVCSLDISAENLSALKAKNQAVAMLQADLTQYPQYKDWLKDFDLVVTAVPGFMGFNTLEAVINCGKNVVDISFFPEDALALDKAAKENNCTVITDCGVAPGMSNLIVGRYNEEIKLDSFECYVGGLPLKPQPPFFYKAPFSPVDVVQEYIRPARLVEKGKIVTKPALSERELINFNPVGALEAFNTDGLRSLVYTMKQIPDMKEKTLRWPGHLDIILALQQAGMFSEKPILFQEKHISPLEFTTKLLTDEWKLGEQEKEFTIMKVVVKGEGKRISYDLYDEYDEESQTSSMARSTGYTCAAAVHLIANGIFTKKGVFPPEWVGNEKTCFDFVLDYLNKRNVNWIKTETQTDD